MKDLLFSLNTVLPLVVMMAIGYLSRAVGWIGERSLREVNACVFRVFLPLTLFYNIMDTDRSASIDAFTLIYAFCASLALFALLFLLVPRLLKERKSVSVMIQGMARSNYALFGIPMVLMMFPDRDTSIAVWMVAAVVPAFNVMSTVALAVYSDQRTTLRGTLKSILLNPLILATALGLVCWLIGLELPALLSAPLRKLGGIASPLALFVLGASLDFGKARANKRLIAVSVAVKLVAVPLVFLSLGVLLGIRGVSLAALIAVFASPTSVSSFPMAQQMGGDGDLAGAQVVFSTVFSVLTVFVWVFALSSLGLLA